MNMNKHESSRGYFAYYIYKEMEKNKDIYVLTGDLGYGMFDNIKKDFPKRFYNVGAAEQALLDISVGLALSGKIPYAYTITPFLYRGFETIRTYINHENIPVKLVGSGRGKDYSHDGFSHEATDDIEVFGMFPNILTFRFGNKEDMKYVVEQTSKINRPFYINLRR